MTSDLHVGFDLGCRSRRLDSGDYVMAKRKTGIAGRWRIKSLTEWDNDFIDAEVPGYINFSKNGLSEFQFGYVRCDIDWEETDRDDEPTVEFSFQGFDEMEQTSGRGWAVLEDGTLTGEFNFFQGDDSGFTAEKSKA